MFKQILVAVDGTPTSTRALVVAIGLAKEQKATLHILHVVDETVIPPNLEGSLLLSHDYMKGVLARMGEIGSKILARAEKSAKAKGAMTKPILITHSLGGIANAILAQARKVHADLLVLGTHGRRGIARIVMGSDAESVVRRSLGASATRAATSRVHGKTQGGFPRASHKAAGGAEGSRKRRSARSVTGPFRLFAAR